MKVIPFKERDADYRVSVRDNIKLDGIPYIWSSNLSDEQLRPGGHSKPASHGHLKTGHLDSSLVG